MYGSSMSARLVRSEDIEHILKCVVGGCADYHVLYQTPGMFSLLEVVARASTARGGVTNKQSASTNFRTFNFEHIDTFVSKI